MKQSIQRNKQKTEIIKEKEHPDDRQEKKTDSRIDAGSTVLLLLDDLVSVTDFVK